MFKRLFLYFASVFVLVLVITTVNNFVREKSKDVNQAIEVPNQLLQKMIGQQEEGESPGVRDVAAVSDNEPVPPIANWLKNESKKLNATNVHQPSKEQEVINVVRSMKTEDIDYLVKTSLDRSVPQTERILSTYMLTLGGEMTQQALIRIASQALKVENPEPHTLSEIQANEEKSLKIMAIDAIYDGQLSPSQKINDLQTIINQVSDKTIRDYAQQKQDQLKSNL